MSTLKCQICGFDDEKICVYCRDCGSRFYDIPELFVIYYSMGPKATFSLPVKNKAELPLLLFLEDDIISNQITPSNISIDFGGRQTSIDEFSESAIQVKLDDIRQLENNPCKIRIPASFDERFFFHSLKLEVRPRPEFDVRVVPARKQLPLPDVDSKEEIFVGPSRGYRANISITLNNGSYAKIESLEVDRATVTDIDLPYILDGVRSSLEFEIEFASMSDSLPEEIVVRCEVANIEQPLEKKFLVNLRPTYQNDDINLTTTRWTDKGLKFLPLKDSDSVNLPVGRSYRKNFSISIKDFMSDYDPILLSDLRIDLPDSLFASPVDITPIPPEAEISAELKISEEVDQANQQIEAEIIDHRAENNRRVIKFPYILNSFSTDKYPWKLGIDFGTSNSCIALSMPELLENGKWDIPPEGDIKTLPLDQSFRGYNPRIIPSILNLEKTEPSFIYKSRFILSDDKWYRKIGHVAEQAENIREVKRLLLQEKIPHLDLSPVDVTKEIIKELVIRAAEYLNEHGIPYSIFNEARLTVPTAFYPKELNRAKKACQDALKEVGFGDADVEIIDESLAALHYLLQNEERGITSDIVIVYDFGGGTTDLTAVVRKVEDRRESFFTVATGGNPRFGGKDVNGFIREIYQSLAGSPEEEDELWFELAKRRLSSREDLEEHIGSGKLNLDQFYTEIYEKVNRKVRAILKDILSKIDRNSDISQNSLSIMCVLAGGSSKLYKFREKVYGVLGSLLNDEDWQRKYTLEGVKRIDLPKQCVSIGAFESQFTGYELLSKQNVTPYSVLWKLPKGVKPKGDFDTITATTHGRKREFVRLIDSGEKLPAKKKINLQDLGYKKTDQVPIEVHFQLGTEEPEREPSFERVPGNKEIEVILDEEKSLITIY